jgi:NAD(P)-dependent dehydrogenase (short-subunit alcohol dehydrogenase family)
MSGVRGVLDGRVAVVTGGASGIGKATVRRFLAEGASVVVGDLNAANGDALLSELDAGERSRVGFVVTDVAEEDAVAQLIATAPDRFGRLDIVFNNAGVGGAFGPITEIEVGAWDRTFAVLVRSVFLAAKAAVVNLTYNTAVELAAHRVRVNAICPGFVVTPLAVGRDEELAKSAVSEFQPWPDHGQPADIAALALFLASDDSRFVTGEAIRADGALLAAGPRMNGLTDPHGAFRRYTGFADGSTGRPVEKRRLAGGERDVRPRPAP